MPVDRDSWRPPPPLPDTPGRRVKGALYGSLLFETPEHRAAAEDLARFLEPEGQVLLEVGFDHGMRLLDQARRHPSWRFVGAEIRRAKVEAARAHAPPNARLLRVDGRTLLATLIPRERLSAIVLWFPTPTENPRHLLLTPTFVELARLALMPGGVVHLATDVPAMAEWADVLFAGWGPGEPPPAPGVLSRRERVCRRDGLTVHERCLQRP